MKYHISINAPIEQVYKLYTDNNNLKHWQEDLISYTNIKGNPGEVGSVRETVYKPVTIYETIKTLSPLSEMVCEYEHQRNGVVKMYHTATTQFEEISQNKTELNLNVDQKVVGLIPKIVMKLFSGAVKKHHQNRLKKFKTFVENQ